MRFRMAQPRLDAIDDLADELGGCLVLTSFLDDRPLRGLTGLIDWRLNGQVSRLMLRDFIDCHYQEVLLTPISGRLPFDRLLLVGLGKRSDFHAQRFEDVCRFCFATLQGLGETRFAMALPGRIGLDVGLRQALLGWRRALSEAFADEAYADLDLVLLESPEVQRELAEPMRQLQKELDGRVHANAL